MKIKQITNAKVVWHPNDNVVVLVMMLLTETMFLATRTPNDLEFDNCFINYNMKHKRF